MPILLKFFRKIIAVEFIIFLQEDCNALSNFDSNKAK